MEWRNLKVWVQGLYSTSGRMEDYSDLYVVSDEGEVKDAAGQTVPQTTSPKMPPYKVVKLTDSNGNSHERYVHRIVATTFSDYCGDINQVVNHLDENKLNNSKFNLSWCTIKENFSYGKAKETSKKNLKLYYKNKKLKEKETNLINEYYKHPELISINER